MDTIIKGVPEIDSSFQSISATLRLPLSKAMAVQLFSFPRHNNLKSTLILFFFF